MVPQRLGKERDLGEPVWVGSPGIGPVPGTPYTSSCKEVES